MQKPDKHLFSQYTRPVEPIPTGAVRSGSLDKAMQGILFDVYGTLFIADADDSGTPAAAEPKNADLIRLLRAYHIEDPADRVQNRMIRLIHHEHARLKKNGIDYPEVRIEDIWMKTLGFKSRQRAENFALAYELIVNPVFPMPHMKRLLEACRAKKLRMGLISNAQFYTPLLFQWFLRKELSDLGFDPELLIFSYRFGYAKPSRLLFSTARERLESCGIAPNRVLYVGNDMLNDIRPAQQTGFHTALFAGDARSLRMRQNNPQCARTAPDLVVTDLIQLLEYV
jgi:putative hydrolase of the HAD superfamily